MKTTAELIPAALTETQEQQTQSESVNTTEWAKYFEFQVEGSTEDVRQLNGMVDEAARFIKAIKAQSQPYWLSLLGTSGAGKTYLARRIWKWYTKSSFFKSVVDPDTRDIAYPGTWCNWPKMAGDLLSNTGYSLLDEMQSDRLVVLDEIGADRDKNGHVKDCLTRLLSARVGKWTIITSNRSLGEIQREIDTRVSSRMCRDGSKVVDVDLPDYSLRKSTPRLPHAD